MRELCVHCIKSTRKISSMKIKQSLIILEIVNKCTHTDKWEANSTRFIWWKIISALFAREAYRIADTDDGKIRGGRIEREAEAVIDARHQLVKPPCVAGLLWTAFRGTMHDGTRIDRFFETSSGRERALHRLPIALRFHVSLQFHELRELRRL